MGGKARAANQQAKQPRRGEWGQGPAQPGEVVIVSAGGWTTSYRWAGVRRSDVAGLIRHDVRDVDRKNGVEVSHSNTGIVSSKTLLNETVVNDGNGGFRRCAASREWLDFIDKRVSEARNFRTQKDGTRTPVAVRKDASVVVETILMLDPEFTGKIDEMSEDKRDEVRDLLQVMIDTEIERAGVENVVGWSVHWDESHPHVQMMTVPMTADGQLSMKKAYGGGQGTKAAAQKKYAELHDTMRENLRDAGYDATMERVDSARSHLPLEKFKTLRDQQTKATQALAKAEARLSIATKDGDAAWRDRQTAQDELQSAEDEALRIRRRARDDGYRKGYDEGLKEAETELAQEQAAARQARERADTQRRAAEAQLALLDETISTVEQVQPVFTAFLDHKMKDGRTLRPMFERFTEQYTAGMRRRSAALRKDMGSWQSESVQGQADGPSR